MAVAPGRTACLACVYPEPPGGVQPTCETAGVLGPVTLAVAALQSADALRILTGHGDEVSAKITTIDVWTGVIRQIEAPARDSECRACGRREFSWLEGARRAPISLCGRNAVQIHERTRPVDLKALARQLDGIGEVRANEFALRATIAPYELTVFPDGRAIVKGTTDVGVARGIYARYIGN
jgi:adenylyltransferase/sulfurtransferase